MHHIGMVSVYYPALKAWHKHICIFSGAYLYFFDNEADDNNLFYFYVKDAVISKNHD